MASTRRSISLDEADETILQKLVESGYPDMSQVFKTGLRMAYAQLLAQDNSMVLNVSAPRDLAAEAVTFDGITNWSPQRLEKAINKMPPSS